MFYWILWSILWAIGDIIYKKALLLSDGKISNKLYQLVWNSYMSVVLLFWYILLDLGFINLTVVWLLLITWVISIISEIFEQIAYKNEKISVLLPFWEFESIITIIVWFLLFSGDTSTLSFIFALLAWIVLVLWSLDFKKFKFNKYCWLLVASAILWSIKRIIYTFVLLNLAVQVFDATVISMITSTIVLFLIALLTKDYLSIKKVNKKMSFFIFLENITRLFVSIISLYLIKELWVVQAVLVGMIYLVFSMFFAFLFLKERPSKKEVLVVLLVFSCITLWTIF